MKDNFHSHKSCFDQRLVATEDVRELFNELQMCEHVLIPLIRILDGGVEDLINLVRLFQLVGCQHTTWPNI